MASVVNGAVGPNYFPNVPASIMSVSPVSTYSTSRAQPERGFALPLNIIATIVSYLDDLGDLARVTRTSRLLYYMTLPQLYRHVTLRSYPDIRYVDGRPEGFGSGSPLCMALSGLSTSNSAALIESFRIKGIWREAANDEYTKGRIPDNSMLLNIVIRNAIDKMTAVQSIFWELDTKPLKIVYQGLAARTSVTSLTLKFSNSRTPRPVSVIPPMPNLKCFRVTDIDPLCYPDDISLLLLRSTKLEDLRIHWSPRMRREAEPSISLPAYFGRSLAAGYRLPLKYFAMQNFYGTNNGDFQDAMDGNTVQECHFIDVFGGEGGGAANVFLDDTWKDVGSSFTIKWKVNRTNEIALQHTKMLNSFRGLEELYLTSPRTSPGSKADAEAESLSPKTVRPRTASLPSPDDSPRDFTVSLGKEYLHAITTSHGETMRCLLLSDQCPVEPEQMASLVRCCPKLEQLGIALNGNSHEVFGFLIPFLPNLRALRILASDWLVKLTEERREDNSWQEQFDEIGRSIYKGGIKNLEWLGIGHDIYHVEPAKQHELSDGELEWRRDLTPATFEQVKHIGIWGLDVLEI